MTFFGSPTGVVAVSVASQLSGPRGPGRAPVHAAPAAGACAPSAGTARRRETRLRGAGPAADGGPRPAAAPAPAGAWCSPAPAGQRGGYGGAPSAPPEASGDKAAYL